MSEEREVVKVGKAKLSETPLKELGKQAKAKLSDENKAKLKDERRARFARVLERGFINDRLDVPLPPELHGEWVCDDNVDIARMESLGYNIDKIHAIKRRLHSKGDDASFVGDVVFMTCSMEDHELMQEIKQERFEAMHGTKTKAQKEEQAYTESVQAKTPEVPVIEESRAREVRKEDIEAALDAKP